MSSCSSLFSLESKRILSSNSSVSLCCSLWMSFNSAGIEIINLDKFNHNDIKMNVMKHGPIGIFPLEKQTVSYTYSKSFNCVICYIPQIDSFRFPQI